MRRGDTQNLFEESKGTDVRSGYVIRVVFDSGVDKGFDYLVPELLWPVGVGQRVEAPFGKGNKPQIGFCVKVGLAADEGDSAGGHRFKLKKISDVIDSEPLVDGELMALAEWISDYYVCPLGQVLSAMIPSAVKKGIGEKKQRYIYLANGGDGSVVEAVKGKKQKVIVEILKQDGAINKDSAVELQEVLKKAECGNTVFKKLAQAGVVGVTEKIILKSLPVIPEGLVEPVQKEIVLNDEQQAALEKISGGIESEKFGVTVLYGVTDSGKTEIYIRAIQKAIEKGKRAIALLPEIALTAQTVQRFSLRFERLAVMHSGLSAGQRNMEWQRIKRGEADVVIGARSAVFAPVTKLGLIVVDEEHEGSYKQDMVPRYNGRDVAIKRAQLASGYCILGSATPSLEMLHNCGRKKHFELVRLRKRVMDLPLPQMKLVDMKAVGSGELISPQLEDAICKVLSRKEQAILLLNRRGYSSFIFCPRCKHSLRCKNCDVTLTFHKAKLSGRRGGGGLETVTGRHLDYGYAFCHYCLSQTLVPQECPLCRTRMIMIGFGSQRLEEELGRKFTSARIARVDSDSMQAKDYYRLLGDFGRGDIDILAGTQILAKGLHFPNVTLVGVVSADTSLALPDFRSNERTFGLISQVAGRAGRSQKGGVVYVQTFLAEQAAIQFAIKYDYEGFVREELKHRENCHLPPYWRLAIVQMKNEKYERLTAACNAMRERIDGIIAAEGLEMTVRGPMDSAISRIERFFRMQIVLQAPDAGTMQRFFGRFRKAGAIRPAVQTIIDIDPVNLL